MKKLVLSLCIISYCYPMKLTKPSKEELSIETKQEMERLEQEQKAGEARRKLLKKSMSLPLNYPHACRPKDIYFPDLKDEDGE